MRKHAEGMYGAPANGTLTDLLLQMIKCIGAEKFTQCDFQTVAKLLNRHNTNVLTLAIENAFQCRLRNSSMIGQPVGRKSALFA